MKRHYKSWLHAFTDYASHMEAPLSCYFWTGVATVAGALRRCVWIDQIEFQWVPNFYVLLVAPPGIISKSTTINIGMKLLYEVPGINFGPSVVTWQALAQALGQSNESIEMPDKLFHPMSAITIAASELGNFLNPSDREMVDLLVSLWDGQKGVFKKLTKTQGQDDIVNPWVNMIACTTPAWLAGNFPEYMIGGGFASRCIFVYAEEKRQYVAYPRTAMPKNHVEIKQKLIDDLVAISNIRGEYVLTLDAERWGRAWYERHHKNRPKLLDNDRFGGYIARKQTHIHKVAMILAAANRQETTIEVDELVEADLLVTDLEKNMPKVFDKIGISPDAKGQAELVATIRAHGVLTNNELYKHLFRILSYEDFLKCLQSAIAAGMVVQVNHKSQLGAKAIYDDGNSESDGDGVGESRDGTSLARASG